MRDTDLAIAMIALANLHPDPNNVNTHDDTNLSQIEASISRFGFADPIGVVEHPDRVTGGYMIVEGHGRWMVAKRLKLSEVPCIVLTLDEAERRGYGIAHNQIQRINSLDLGVVSGEFARLGVTADDYPSLGFTTEDALFLPAANVAPLTGDQFSAPDGGEYQEQGQGTSAPEPDAKGSWAQFVPPVHRTEMRFASDVGLTRFVALLNLLRQHYPLTETHGERLALFLRDKGLVAARADGETADAAA